MKYDFRRVEKYLIRLYSLNIKSEIWRRSLNNLEKTDKGSKHLTIRKDIEYLSYQNQYKGTKRNKIFNKGNKE